MITAHTVLFVPLCHVLFEFLYPSRNAAVLEGSKPRGAVFGGGTGECRAAILAFQAVVTGQRKGVSNPAESAE
jgi:hypothetical protein